MSTQTAELRYIAGGREIRKYSNGYWYIRLTDVEMEEYPGTSWSGYVVIHKWKWWVKYGEHYWYNEGSYRYADGNQDNIRITNITVKPKWR